MPEDHLYFTFVDIGFGLILGVSIEYLVNIIEKTPNMISDGNIGSLHITGIFFFTALTIIIITLKWVMYRETIVYLYNRDSLHGVIKDFVDKNLEFLSVYLIIEFLLALSPIIYLTALELESVPFLNPPWFMKDIFLVTLFIFPNYLADIFVTHSSIGLYGRLMDEVKNSKLNLKDKQSLLKKLGNISNSNVTAMNMTFLLVILLVGLCHIAFGQPDEPWGITIIILVLLADTLVAFSAAYRIIRGEEINDEHDSMISHDPSEKT